MTTIKLIAVSATHISKLQVLFVASVYGYRDVYACMRKENCPRLTTSQ